MAETLTKKSGFKETMQKAGQRTKDYTKKKSEQVKTYVRNYKSDIRKAYDTGYARGGDDSYDIPKRFGAKTVAAYGYKKGVRNRRRSDKYTNQYNRGGKKQ